jgi:hypothetical protein
MVSLSGNQDYIDVEAADVEVELTSDETDQGYQFLQLGLCC